MSGLVIDANNELKRSGYASESGSLWQGLLRPSWMGKTPEGLESQLEDDKWYLGLGTSASEFSSLTINWSYGWSSSLLNRHVYWQEYAKKVTFYCMESDLTECRSTGTLANYGREVRSICAWFQGERRCQDIASITPNDVIAYEKYVGRLDLTVNSVITKLTCLRMMWVLRSEVGEGLTFDPYIRSGSLVKKAKVLGRPNGHTKTIVPNELFKVIDQALKAISEETDKWVEREKLYRELCSRYSKTNRSVKFRGLTGLSSGELHRKLDIMYGAAIVLVLALSAERKHELGNTTMSDVESLLNGQSDELKGVERKTSGTATGKETSRPVVEELKLALELILKLTMANRESYNGDKLFIYHQAFTSAPSNSQVELKTNRIYRLLDKFSVHCGLDYSLRPHMFRRAFAMMWAWRFEVGDLSMLSRLLYHNNEVFTRFYTEDEDVWQFLSEAQQEYTYDFMTSALMGATKLRGGIRKAMERYSRLLLSKVTVLDPEAVAHFAEMLINRLGYKVVPQADGFCFMTSARGRRAKCSTDGKRPNYANRDDSMCVGCGNFGVDETRRAWWEQRRSAHEKVLEKSEIPIMKKASEEAINRADIVLRWIDEDV